MIFPIHKTAEAITLRTPRTFIYGAGRRGLAGEMLRQRESRRALLIVSRSCLPHAEEMGRDLEAHGVECEISHGVPAEPSVDDFKTVCSRHELGQVDTVVAMGGGSILDVGKLVAAVGDDPDSLPQFFGQGKLKGRSRRLVCLPTTAGAGSEASPNAILVDPKDHSKKAVISPFLVPDIALVDPELSVTLPSALTASTGFDALSHCIEAFTNKHAHFLVDGFAIQGIQLIARFLHHACTHGDDTEARGAMAMGSYLGGLCLGPVNTAGVHALSYPLGTCFGLGHGLANSLLLAPVMRFNLPSNPHKFAIVAKAMGVEGNGPDEELAASGIAFLQELSAACGLGKGLEDYGVKESDLPELANQAMKVERLLKNNPRRLDYRAALKIYEEALHPHEYSTTI